ncbi:hypothetical protein M409DRAFT_19467 [Zasmidium cellare ATCC 36951]|uniref:Uncharacterized protein n=1 Tax=Zasmidium cellare ATCC 36951 TaxID=1080233 RepID=A0A6A6CXR4_ZASCE|nr:uncharacterized protein M409DRAFT_19467 [Zasmidium cellare ATCC 36951]KAF2170652.1 hypothetical protein M409DRAFT_19467 [Zasmidium cellare ATCC 36951]
MQNLDGIDPRLEEISTQLDDQLEDLRHVKAAADVNMNVFRPVAESLEQFARLRNRQQHFLEKLIIFLFAKKEKRVNDNRQWRRQGVDSGLVAFGGQDHYDQLVREKLEAKSRSGEGQSGRPKTAQEENVGKESQKCSGCNRRNYQTTHHKGCPQGLANDLLELPDAVDCLPKVPILDGSQDYSRP